MGELHLLENQFKIKLNNFVAYNLEDQKL